MSLDTNCTTSTEIKQFDWEGKIMRSSKIDDSLTPIYFWLDDINEQYLYVAKTENDSSNNSSIKVDLLNFNDSLLWSNQFEINGEFVNSLVTNSNFFLLFNYTSFNSNQFEISDIEDKHQKIGGLYINRDGEFQHFTSYQTSGDLFINTAKKLTNNTINLVGEIHEIENTTKQNLYLLINEVGELKFSNKANINVIRKTASLN